MDLTSLLIGIVIGLIAGIILARFLFPQKEQNDNGLIDQLREDLKSAGNKEQQLLTEKSSLHAELASAKTLVESTELRLEEERKRMEVQKEESKKELERIKKEMTDQFELAANKILDVKTAKFKESNSELMQNIVNPLQTNIKEFKEKVERYYTTENEQRGVLKGSIEELLKMNQQLSKGAENLTQALKGDSKMQGDWGEEQLAVVLEKSGLEEEVHYTRQASFQDEEGKRKQPDFLVNLPEDKKLIIDAKVSLTAYARYHEAKEEEQKNIALAQHLESLRQHIKGLGKRDYEKLYDIATPDFVLMYIPIEPALFLAMASDSGLYDEALRQNVVLVSTTTLLATMRTVRYTWTQENQKENFMEIIRQSEKLYDKFRGFTEDLQKVGTHLEKSHQSYEDALNKLSQGRGNLVRQVEQIRKLSGYKPKKAIDEHLIETSTNEDHEE